MSNTTFFLSPKAECFQIVGNQIAALRQYLLNYLLEDIWFDEDDFDTGRLMEAIENPIDPMLTKAALRDLILAEEVMWLTVPEEYSDRGRQISIMDMACNSAMQGDRKDQLAARLVLDRWVHGYIERDSFAWLHDTLQNALDEGLLADEIDGVETGWGKVMASLTKISGPLVLAGAAGFPNDQYCPVNRGEDFKALSVEERWKRSLRRLRSEGREFEWKPGSFADRRFGDGIDGKTFLTKIA